jgi:hypothetical protein
LVDKHHSKDMSTTKFDSASKEIVAESVARATAAADISFGNDMTESAWAKYLHEMSPEKNENPFKDVIPPAPSGWDVHQLTVGRFHLDQSIFPSTSNNATVNAEGLQFHPSIFDDDDIAPLPSRNESEDSAMNSGQKQPPKQP